MDLPLLTRLKGRRPLSGSRWRRVVLWGTWAVVTSSLLIYHAYLSMVGQPPTSGTRLTADLLAIASAVLLGYLLSRHVDRWASNPVRALWLPVLTGLLGLAFVSAFVTLTGGHATIDPATGLPASLRGATQVFVISIVEVVVAVVLLFSLRSLILFRRTRLSERQWWALLGLMGAASLVLMGHAPTADVGTVPHSILLGFSILVMVSIAFRLAWIAYLPFRRKMGALGLCLALLALIIVVMSGRGGGGFGAGEFDAAVSAVYSVPVSRFVTLLLSFGILYTSTAVLALLFHLPTAGALEQKSGEMEAIQMLARLSGEVFEHDQLVDTVARAPVESGLAQAAWLAIVDPGSGSLRPRLAAAHGLTASQIRAMTETEQLAVDANQAGAPIVIGQAPADHRVHARPGDGIGSLLVLPLRAHDEALGALFATRSVPQSFLRDDVAALETFASQAALALSNARLFAERLERERLARELAIAREVQQRLAPRELPCSERLSSSALSLPAQEVAGDFYDVLNVDEHRIGLIVADVAGKGTSAAFHMAELKGIFQSVGRLETSPAAFLSRANAALADSLQRASFISAVYAVIDQRNGALTLARAGHCPAILASRNGEVRMLRPGGLGLGLDRSGLFESSIHEETVELAPGDTLLLFTDGIVEARGPNGDEYGYERLVEAMAQHHHREPDDLRDALVAELRKFADNGNQGWEDDLTLLVLQWSGLRHDPTTADKHAPPLHESISA